VSANACTTAATRWPFENRYNADRHEEHLQTVGYRPDREPRFPYAKIK